MSIKLCVLGSGSRGNCTFIGTETTRILIDAGLSARKTAVRLAEIGETIEAIDAICVTHEHGDHIAGIRVLHKKYGIPVYANGGTMEGVRCAMKGSELKCFQFTTGSGFGIGDMQLEPFPLSHDAYEPVGFVIRTGGRSIGLATDIGIVTHLLREKLRTCEVVVIESNHDEVMVHEAPRPWSLKQRILSNQGHLSNRASAGLIAEIAGEGLKHLFLAHLSADCNSPSHARREFETVFETAGHDHVKISLTSADSVSEVLDIGTGCEELSIKETTVEYSYSRLCFKAEFIESLLDDDKFCVNTPDGRFQMTKKDFYEVFSNVAQSRAYVEDGLYHYPAIPKKAMRFLLQ